MDEKKLKILNDARHAAIAYDAFSHFLEQAKKDALSKMTQCHRDPSSNQNLYGNYVAAYCALEDLDNTIKRAINKANSIEREVING